MCAYEVCCKYLIVCERKIGLKEHIKTNNKFNKNKSTIIFYNRVLKETNRKTVIYRNFMNF